MLTATAQFMDAHSFFQKMEAVLGRDNTYFGKSGMVPGSIFAQPYMVRQPDSPERPIVLLDYIEARTRYPVAISVLAVARDADGKHPLNASAVSQYHLTLDRSGQHSPTFAVQKPTAMDPFQFREHTRAIVQTAVDLLLDGDPRPHTVQQVVDNLAGRYRSFNIRQVS